MHSFRWKWLCNEGATNGEKQIKTHKVPAIFISAAIQATDSWNL